MPAYTAIEVDHVSKVFKRRTGAGNTLFERFLSIGSGTTEEFNALDDVAFDVKAGETVGILGHNGSGKSTMLKIISGTIRPNQGAVRVRGSMSALLELGAGFHPDLTGRENVYLNGSILGFSKLQIDQMMDDIIDFSEIPAFIDTQVKNYSSGMFARLGFAVAVNLKPDVLLIDEVLAVGDEAFQRKCLERIRGFQRDGRTILLVTHSPDMVRVFCDKAVVLNEGKMIYCGDPGDAVISYRDALEARTGVKHGDYLGPAPEAMRAPPIVVSSVEMDPPQGGREQYEPRDSLRFTINYAAGEAIREYGAVRLRFILYSHDGILLANLTTMDVSGKDIDMPEPGRGRFTVDIDRAPLMTGRYEVTVILQSVDETREFDRKENVLRFNVGGDGAPRGRVALDLSVGHSPETTRATGAKALS